TTTTPRGAATAQKKNKANRMRIRSAMATIIRSRRSSRSNGVGLLSCYWRRLYAQASREARPITPPPLCNIVPPERVNLKNSRDHKGETLQLDWRPRAVLAFYNSIIAAWSLHLVFVSRRE